MQIGIALGWRYVDVGANGVETSQQLTATIEQAGDQFKSSLTAYPFDGRNHRRPTAIFLGQPLGFLQNVGSDHQPRATTTPVTDGAIGLRPLLPHRSLGGHDRGKPGNRRPNLVYLSNQLVELGSSRRIIGFLPFALQKRFEAFAIIDLHHFDAREDRCRERPFFFDIGGRGLFDIEGCPRRRSLARP